MHNEQFTSSKKKYSAPEQYEQMSIFDVLAEEHWGDARPEDYSPNLNHQEWENEERRSADIERIRAKIKSRKQESDREKQIEQTCVWCGDVIDGPLDEHEDECSS